MVEVAVATLYQAACPLSVGVTVYTAKWATGLCRESVWLPTRWGSASEEILSTSAFSAGCSLVPSDSGNKLNPTIHWRWNGVQEQGRRTASVTLRPSGDYQMAARVNASSDVTGVYFPSFLENVWVSHRVSNLYGYGHLILNSKGRIRKDRSLIGNETAAP